MGSRSKADLAYIAGFLDGDGSLMLQIKKRKDGKLKYRFLVDRIIEIQKNNYVTRKKKTRDELLKVLGLTP